MKREPLTPLRPAKVAKGARYLVAQVGDPDGNRKQRRQAASVERLANRRGWFSEDPYWPRMKQTARIR